MLKLLAATMGVFGQIACCLRPCEYNVSIICTWKNKHTTRFKTLKMGGYVTSKYKKKLKFGEDTHVTLNLKPMLHYVP